MLFKYIIRMYVVCLTNFLPLFFMYVKYFNAFFLFDFTLLFNTSFMHDLIINKDEKPLANVHT